MIPAANTLGGRGSRSDSAGVRRTPDPPQPAIPQAIAHLAIRARPRPSLGTLVGLAAGALVAGSLLGGFDLDQGISVSFLGPLLGGAAVVLLIFFRRFHAARLRARGTPVSISTDVDTPVERTTIEAPPSGRSSLDQGLAGIRRADPGFDPTRLAGYIRMVFRDAQAAWATQQLSAMRDRVTPEMYVELQAQCAQLLTIGQVNRVERIEIVAEVTEAWQEKGRDYVTACIDGSIIDYTVGHTTESVIHGSRTVPRDIEEFWTFTRPAGLNFWMLSAIQRA